MSHEETTLGQIHDRKCQLMDILEEATIIYINQLRSCEGAPSYRYLQDNCRLTDEMITHFRLGYATKSWKKDQMGGKLDG